MEKSERTLITPDETQVRPLLGHCVGLEVFWTSSFAGH
jgi:hypothetical protein